MSRQNLDRHLAKKDLSKSNHFIVSEFIAQNLLDIKKHRLIIELGVAISKIPSYQNCISFIYIFFLCKS